MYYPWYTIVLHSRHGRRAVVGREVLVSSRVGWVNKEGAVGIDSDLGSGRLSV